MPTFPRPAKDFQFTEPSMLEWREGYSHDPASVPVLQTYRRTKVWSAREGSRVTTTPTGSFRPMTSFARTRGVVTEVPSLWKYERISNGEPWLTQKPFVAVAYSPTIHVDGNWYPTINTNNYNRLSTECLLKLKAQKVNFGEALGESVSTANHLAKTASSLFRGFLAARKGNWPAVAREFGKPRRGHADKAVSGRILEYQFGWLPLMNDIMGTYELLEKGLRKELLFSVTRKITETLPVRDSMFNDVIVSGESTSIMRMKLYAKVEISALHKLTQMGLTSPAQVAWALTPWSFFVDWMLPLGNVLDAMTAPMGLSFVGGAYSSRVSYTGIHTSKETPTVYNGWNLTSQTPRSATLKIEGYRRTALGGFPFPLPYFKSPFSTSHVLSALSLFSQLRR